MHKDYLQELGELREMLEWLLRKDLLQELVTLQELLNRSTVPRYEELVENSEHGCDCGYAVKAKEVFMAFQEKPIAEKITYIYNTFIKER